MKALDEVKPAFGVSEEELANAIDRGILHYSPYIEHILNDGRSFVNQVRNSATTSLLSVLLHGPPGSGKTALAAAISQASEFPFIKLASAENMVGFSEMAKIQYLNKVFTDAYKSPLNIVVVDNIERLIEWVPIGPRFSNPVLQALMVLLTKKPPAVSIPFPKNIIITKDQPPGPPPPHPRDNVKSQRPAPARPAAHLQLRARRAQHQHAHRARCRAPRGPGLRQRAGPHPVAERAEGDHRL
jgi:hypothetical protein